MVEADPDLAGDDALGGRHIGTQVAGQGAEPQAVVDEAGQLVRHEGIEPERVARQRQPLERPVGGVEDGRGRRLVDLAALDPDQPVLDVVDTPHAVRAAEGMQPVHERHGPSRSPSRATGMPPSKSMTISTGSGASPGATVHS